MNGATTLDMALFFGSIAFIVFSAFIGSHSLLRKLISIVAVMLGAALLVTAFLKLMPGSPVDHILGEQAEEAARVQLAQDLHLIDDNGDDIGLVGQYGYFLTSLAKNELLSYRTRTPVLSSIAGRLPYTLFLALFAMAFALLFGPLLGLLAAARKGKWLDHGTLIFAMLFVSMPRIWLSPLLILVFAIWLGILPPSGSEAGFLSVILPGLSLGTALSAILARMSRASLLDVLSEDFIRTAHAKGLPSYVVTLKHALKNALIPILTVAGLQFGALLSGTVVTEKIFNWPGIGLLLLEGIQQLDMPVVQGTILTIAFGFVLVNFFVDLLYRVADPRIRVASTAGGL